MCLSRRQVPDPPASKDFHPVLVKEQEWYRPVFQMLSEANKLKDILLEMVKQIADSKLPTPRRVALSGWADLLLDAHVCGSFQGKHMLDRHDFTFIVNIIEAVPTYFRDGMLERTRSVANDAITVMGGPKLFENDSNEKLDEPVASVIEKAVTPESPTISSDEEWEEWTVHKEPTDGKTSALEPLADGADLEMVEEEEPNSVAEESAMPESSNYAVVKGGKTWIEKALAFVLPKGWLWG